MIDGLRDVRLGRGTVAIIAVLSAGATALVISTGSHGTEAQTAALAALKQRPVLIREASAKPAATAPVNSSTPEAVTTPMPSPNPATATSSPSPAGNTGAGGTAPAATTVSAATTTTTTTSSTTSAAPLKVHHVFVIALSATSFDQAFGQSSPAHYLNRTLVPEGAFLGGYQTLGRAELPDLLAMVSGQAPNPDTNLGCPSYSEFPPNTKPNAAGQIPGDGCVYPNTITSIADEFTAQGLIWKGYVEGIAGQTCPHPNSDAVDTGAVPGAGPQYDTRHNPFIYFHSLLDLGGCAENDVSLNELSHDLGAVGRTPSFAFITPGLCSDAATATCTDGQGAGIVREDAFLKHWVPRIRASAAYKRDGVLIIAFTSTAPTPASGGPVPAGALVLSRYAARGTVISTAYDPYSLLRSVESLFGFAPLAHASTAKSFVSEALPGA